MRVQRRPISTSDERGWIRDIVQDDTFHHATIVQSKTGAVRGNHYHKQTLQMIYVMSGALRAFSRVGNGPVESTDVQSGDLVVNVPFEAHALQALEDSVFLVLARGPRGGTHYESDTFRLDVPLIEAEVANGGH